jgi:hypothetical protein
MTFFEVLMAVGILMILNGLRISFTSEGSSNKKDDFVPTMKDSTDYSNALNVTLTSKSLNLEEIAKSLFEIRHDKNALRNYIDNLGYQLKLRGKVRETEKWVRIAEQVRSLVQTAYDVQILSGKIKRLALEDEKQELELERDKTKLQLEIDTLAEYERRKKELEIKDLELDIAKKEAEIKGYRRENEEKAPDESLLQSVRTRLKVMKAKGTAAEEVEEERDMFLKKIDQNKKPELYKKIKHMYDDFLIEVMK